jgi:hypothetical protein
MIFPGDSREWAASNPSLSITAPSSTGRAHADECMVVQGTGMAESCTAAKHLWMLTFEVTDGGSPAQPTGQAPVDIAQRAQTIDRTQDTRGVFYTRQCQLTHPRAAAHGRGIVTVVIYGA